MLQRFFIVLTAAVFAVSVFASGGNSALAEVKLRIGHVTTIKAIAGRGSTKFKETAEQLSNGEIKVTIFPNGQLGGELEMVSQVRLGTLDIAMVGSGLAANIEPTFSITELPFIWKSRESAWEVLSGPIGDKILGLMEPKGIKGLGWGVWGFRGFLTNGFPIEAPGSMKGRKMRIVENPLYVQTIKAFGGNPVPMAWPEVYTGLQQKAIDGVETNYHGMGDAKLYEVASHLSLTNHIYTATVYLMNMDRFAGLSKKHQEIILKAAKAAGETMRDGAQTANENAIAKMQKNGIKVIKPDRAAFVAKAQKVHDRFSVLVGPQLLKEVKAAQ
jgi:tripartite ATP-independent transporter DctP family solute receptor